MSGLLTVYISAQATERGLWRVRCDGRPTEEFRQEQDAMCRANERVQMAENAGSFGLIKIERPDGS